MIETKELDSMKNELLQMKQNLQDHYGVMMKECIKL